MSQREPAARWLSVLVPVHNVGAYIEACLDSVLGQDGLDDGVEVLVLDDASSDGSGDLVERIVARHPRQLRLLRQARNDGVSAARNRLLEQARGDYVWFVDADDVVLPGALAGLKDVIRAHAPDLVLCDFAYLRAHHTLRHRLRGERHQRSFDGRSNRVSRNRGALVAGLLNAGELHVWSKIARREAWRRASFPEHRYFEDIAVIAPLLRGIESYFHVDAPWIGYRQHEASIMAAMSPAKLRDWLVSVEELQQGLLGSVPPLPPMARRAVRGFAMKSVVSVLRRMEADDMRDPSLQGEVAAAHARMFPRGTGHVLADWRRRGWLLRVARARNLLRRHGLA